MATGIKSEWFEGSPQLCVRYLVLTAKSVLYHSCWSRVITAGVPDLPVTGKRSFLFEFACYASLCFSRSWRWVTWNIFLTVQKLEAGVRSCPLSLSTTINRHWYGASLHYSRAELWFCVLVGQCFVLSSCWMVFFLCFSKSQMMLNCHFTCILRLYIPLMY